MKSTDLRIGNWAMGNKPFKVTGNDIGLAWAHEKLNGEERYISIPLTEEILLKANCKMEVKNTYGELSYLTPPVNNKRTRICKGEDGLFYSPINMFTTVKLPFVHTFQNYMFIMDEQEIKIKL